MLAGTHLLDWLKRMMMHPSMVATFPGELDLPHTLRALEAA
jgi:hypothetical protein